MKSITSIIILLQIIFSEVRNAETWTYDNIGAWPGQCNVGRVQSPINIEKKSTINQYVPLIQFRNYNRPFKVDLINTGYTVEIKLSKTVDASTYPNIIGGNLDSDYTLDNIHFHWDAEHTVDERRYSLEGHFVHYKTIYGNVSNAIRYYRGVAVVGVFYNRKLLKNKVFEDIIKTVPQVSRRVDVRVELPKQLTIADLLPIRTNQFYFYDGSLTTPECNEGVQWIVLETPSFIGKKQLTRLSNIYTSEGKPLVKNFRPLQRLNGRPVFYRP